ncbi:MAG: hypothetical protein ACRDJE_07825 [Dehalococcoidia bacterium]
MVTESVPGPREVYLHRRLAVLRPDRIDVRPARGAVIAPLAGFLIGIVSALAIWFGMTSLPLWLLAILLIVAIIAIPFAGIGTVYALVGAHVVVDRAKQSATWQQGFLGMGVGTTELVPFWKVDRIIIEEAGASETDTGRPVEEFAQWRIVMLKKSGKRLDIGVASAAQALREEAFDRAWTVADAIAEMTNAPVEVYNPSSDTEADSQESVVRQPDRAEQGEGPDSQQRPPRADDTREVRA